MSDDAGEVNWGDKASREAFLEQFLRVSISAQIRALREQRGWSQDDLALMVSTTQSAISRLEDPATCRPTIRMLERLAAVFDCALDIRFAKWSEFIAYVDAFYTSGAPTVESYANDRRLAVAQAKEKV